MNRVLDHIDRHLDQPLDLAALAAVAHFSPYHFHRLFAAWMGETLGDYLRRRRLEVAALMLAGKRQTPVLTVALEVGFGSGEALARAFKLHFGQSPSAWRRATPQRWAAELQARFRNPGQAERKPDQAPDATWPEHGRSHPQEERPMQVSIQQLPATRVAYMRHIGPYGPDVARFWSETFLPWRAAQGLEQAACFGIGHDDPSVARPDKCRYDACVAVPADFKAAAAVSLAELPGGRYAVARFEGRGSDISRAWTELLRDWLPASGLQIDGRPCFEHYPPGARHDPATGVFECEICIPVR